MYDSELNTAARAQPLLLRLDSSLSDNSASRSLADELADQLMVGGAKLLSHHDLSDGIPQLDRIWLQAAFTESEQQTAEQRQMLALSEKLVAELKSADILLISAPVYNFSIPSQLKAWLDHVARARMTFRYTENGPEGLLKNKKAYVVMSSGGTELGSEIDFAWRYLKHMLAFMGIEDVALVAADQLMVKGDSQLQAARQEIARLAESAGVKAPA